MTNTARDWSDNQLNEIRPKRSQAATFCSLWNRHNSFLCSFFTRNPLSFLVVVETGTPPPFVKLNQLFPWDIFCCKCVPFESLKAFGGRMFHKMCTTKFKKCTPHVLQAVFFFNAKISINSTNPAVQTDVCSVQNHQGKPSIQSGTIRGPQTNESSL